MLDGDELEQALSNFPLPAVIGLLCRGETGAKFELILNSLSIHPCFSPTHTMQPLNEKTTHSS